MKKIILFFLLIPCFIFSQTNYSLCFDGNDDYIDLGDILNNIITVYPNPFSEYTVIEFAGFNHDYYTIQIIEMSGKLVKEYTDINEEKLRIDKSLMRPGVYFIHLINNKGTLVERKKIIMIE